MNTCSAAAALAHAISTLLTTVNHTPGPEIRRSALGMARELAKLLEWEPRITRRRFRRIRPFDAPPVRVWGKA